MSRHVVSAIALLALGCGDDAGGAGGTDAGTGTTAAHSTGPGTSDPGSTGPATTSQDTSSSGAIADESSSGGSPMPTGDLAGGIQLGEVIGNQAVDIPLVVEGAAVATADRVAPLIAGRPLLVRAGYALDDDFSPRSLTARLSLEGPDGAEVFDDVRRVTGPGDPSSLGGTFQWGVPAESVTADATFRVEVFEAAEVDTIGTLGRAAVPEAGPAELAAWGDRMVLDIMLVPFSCPGEGQVDVTPEDLADFESYLFNTFPITELNVEVHEVVPSDNCSEFDAAESDLPALRDAEDAPPWVYYGGLLPGDGGGYSISIEGGDQMDYRRTFANHTWRLYGLTFDLFAHELGHNHGRLHTFEDPDFPAENGGNCGAITGHGWGVTPGNMPRSGYSNDLELGLDWIDPNAMLLQPTLRPCDGNPNANENSFNDMMSYAYPYWVSVYSYAAYADRIRTISSWRAAADTVVESEVVRLVVDSEGRVHESRSRSAFVEPSNVDLVARCGAVTVPVRMGTAVHDRRETDGRWAEDLYPTYTFSVPVGMDASQCVVQTPSEP